MKKLFDGFKRKLSYTMFQMKIRKALKDCDKDQLKIILKETREEIERRNKQK